VIRGICGDALPDSYGPERGKVGDEVLKDAGRITKVGTLRNPVAQGARNLVAHFMLGLPAFQEKFAEVMTGSVDWLGSFGPLVLENSPQSQERDS